ncbi:nuclear transport factor 2 family protein [Mangrovivirga sp. M17]|uniref:Nuclear transport factor 2 family protein n=1 Tax=Mangrovivirga halotolerans TaxID=2993936 RepID=A0ABT3RUW0_9BACT|nr:nuclear transport factor 2 family protein [Mangrovivirga halotolerans]MCX2745568.1 nuclear transport factor 2 family protein [Mangrovivirga halotolerans]
MLTEKDKIRIIEEYIAGYNEYNIDKMLKSVSKDVHFMNITHDFITLNIHGKNDFRTIAEKSKEMFKSRKQEIDDVCFKEDTVEVDVNYSAIINLGMRNQLSADEKLIIRGKSLFKFNDNQIVEIQDIFYP